MVHSSKVFSVDKARKEMVTDMVRMGGEVMKWVLSPAFPCPKIVGWKVIIFNT